VVRLRTFLSCLLLVAGCDEPVALAPDAAAPVLPRVSPSPTVHPSLAATPARAPTRAPTPARRAREAPVAGEVVRVAAGTLHVGSRPGWPHRVPWAEADLVPVDVPAFDIDALPQPNDPGRPIELAETRAEASRMCEARGRRLCHELEWERACRGDGVDPYATGDTLDLAACLADPLACPSSVGVLDLGVRVPEWTASDAGEHLAQFERTAVARGARPDHSEAAHRCGSRHATDPAAPGRPLAVRCCGGEAPELAYPDVGARRVFRDLELDGARWRRILATIPEVARFADAFVPFGEPAAGRALARGGATAENVTWEVAPGPFAWSPTTGEEVWIVAGESGAASLLVALYPGLDDTFHHAASFVFAEPDTPIAILRERGQRRELQWTTCWSCGGESGSILFDEDARILIAQR
jgi:formylglycine-generating enzyme required for sulfatase activity